jgi:2-polyprenyl-3-methyl-5-hydroxy-6-metoxy-1,4-benzoquinol methylase
MSVQSNDSIDKNYRAQEENIKKLADEKEQWFFEVKNQDSAAYKFIVEPLQYLEPFLDPAKTWLTVADYNGSEAHYLQQQEVKNVTASDLSDAMLKEAKGKGFINDYSRQNVESMTYGDNAFDYVMCKQAFHHFPRAYQGLYEMLRVSKMAAILVAEPIDILSKMASLMVVKNVLDRINPLLINKLWKNRFSFETVGNYVFKVSEREMEKIAMGIGLPFIAFKRLNIFATHETIEGLGDVPLNQKVYKRIRRKLALRNLVSAMGIIPYGSLGCVLFKEQPTGEVIRKMKDQGFITLQLPANPYLV